MKNPNPPAFPNLGWYGSQPATEVDKGGMTLRDYFAGRSLHGLVQHWGNTTTPELARRAYELADAMLAERAKP